MALKQKLFAELDLYLNGEKFEKPHVIINVANLATYKMASEEEKEKIKQILKDHRVCEGIYREGFRIFYDPETMNLQTESIAIVTIKVINSKNRPKAIATFNDNIISVHLGGKTFTRNVSYDNEGNIQKINPIQVQLSALSIENAFYNAAYSYEQNKEVCTGKIDFEMIKFDKESVETFYSFDKHTCIKLTPAMVDKYWNGNNMNLKRHSVNLTSSSNGWGLNFPVWSSTLIEVDWGAAYIDEDLTKEEIDIIAKGHESSWIVRDVRQKYKAMHNNDEEDKENKKQTFKKIVNDIQELININSEEIINRTIAKLGYSTDSFDKLLDSIERINAKRNFLASHEERFGLDCGFLYFRFSDPNFSDLTKEVSAYGCSEAYEDGTFTMNIPYENQSTTLKRYQAEVIKEMVKKYNLPEISYKTVLD